VRVEGSAYRRPAWKMYYYGNGPTRVSLVAGVWSATSASAPVNVMRTGESYRSFRYEHNLF